MSDADKRARIAVVIRRFGSQFGGAEAYVEHLTNELRKTYDIHVFCQAWASDAPIPHTTVPRTLGLPNWLNLLDFTWRCQKLTKSFDLVHSHENSWLGKIHGVHVMPVRFSRLHNRRSWRRQLSTWSSPRLIAYLVLEALRYRQANRQFVAVSPLTLWQIKAAYRKYPHLSIIPPGVHMPACRLDRHEACRILDLPTDRRYALLVAHEPLRKGLATLLGALRHIDSDVDLLVVGGYDGTPTMVRKLAEAAGLWSRVRTWPLQSDLATFYRAADICTFFTSGDAFGMVPLEAMSYGRPVIMSSSRHCGLAHYVTHGVDGLLVDDPRNSHTAASAINLLLGDESLYEKLSVNGRKLAQDMSWQKCAHLHSALYQRVLSGTRIRA